VNAEDLPRTVLTCGACLVSGFILAMWCMPLLNSKPRTPIQKTGFSITLPAAQLKNNGKLSAMRGKLVRFTQGSQGGSTRCVIDHIPLSFSVQDGLAFFSGGIEALENFVINVSISDLRVIDLVDASVGAEVTDMPSCRLHPRVSYGE
jgi:hypothetical protein